MGELVGLDRLFECAAGRTQALGIRGRGRRQRLIRLWGVRTEHSVPRTCASGSAAARASASGVNGAAIEFFDLQVYPEGEVFRQPLHRKRPRLGQALSTSVGYVRFLARWEGDLE